MEKIVYLIIIQTIIRRKCKNNLKTIYLGTENQLKDLNYIAELRGENKCRYRCTRSFKR